MDPEVTMLNEVREEGLPCEFTYMQNLRNGKKKLTTTRLADTEDNLVADKGGRGGWGNGAKG